MPKARRRPSYLLHKSTGQARVIIGGKSHYLGLHGTPESLERYHELVEEWLASEGNVDRITLTVDDLAISYLAHCRDYYRKNGEPTGETDSIRAALRYAVAEAGTTRARHFGPLALKRVRQRMIDAGMTRGSINQNVGRVRRMFKWASGEELLPATIFTALQTVTGLLAGRTTAREATPVRPVSLAAVEAIEAHVARQVWAMVQLQLLTGARPGEVLTMRSCDLNMAGAVWEYTPESHKTQHHGRRRVVFIGPRAQDVLRPWLRTDLRAPLFSPAEAMEDRHASQRRTRKSPMTPSQKLREERARERERQQGDCYTADSYRRAIARACEIAFEMPPELKKVPKSVPEPERSERRQRAKEWRDQHCWHPHQLRHTAATIIRREFGLEVARTVLGHASADITEIYAERDFTTAREAAARLG